MSMVAIIFDFGPKLTPFLKVIQSYSCKVLFRPSRQCCLFDIESRNEHKGIASITYIL